jgi:serine/threonine protein kinase
MKEDSYIPIVIDRSYIDEERIEKIISLGNQLIHPNILTIKISKNTEHNFYYFFIENLEDSITLGEYLESKITKKLPENEIYLIFQQIVLAIEHLHQFHLNHSKINLDNIFITKEGIVKVGEFILPNFSLLSLLPNYKSDYSQIYFTSPECWNNDFKMKGLFNDIWSLGILLYIMIFGTYPFKGIPNKNEIIANIREKKIIFPTQTSEECRFFISSLLNLTPYKRPTIDCIMKHRFWNFFLQKKNYSSIFSSYNYPPFLYENSLFTANNIYVNQFDIPANCMNSPLQYSNIYDINQISVSDISNNLNNIDRSDYTLVEDINQEKNKKNKKNKKIEQSEVNWNWENGSVELKEFLEKLRANPPMKASEFSPTKKRRIQQCNNYSQNIKNLSHILNSSNIKHLTNNTIQNNQDISLTNFIFRNNSFSESSDSDFSPLLSESDISEEEKKNIFY